MRTVAQIPRSSMSTIRRVAVEPSMAQASQPGLLMPMVSKRQIRLSPLVAK